MFSTKHCLMLLVYFLDASQQQEQTAEEKEAYQNLREAVKDYCKAKKDRVAIYLFQHNQPRVQRIDLTPEGHIIGVAEEKIISFPPEMSGEDLLIATKDHIMKLDANMEPHSATLELPRDGSVSEWHNISGTLNEDSFEQNYGDPAVVVLPHNAGSGYIPEHDIAFVCGRRVGANINKRYPCRFIDVSDPEKPHWLDGSSDKYVKNNDVARTTGYSVAVHRSKIYLTGSYAFEPINEFFVFDYENATWRLDLPRVPAPTMRHASAVIDEKLVICGGMEMDDPYYLSLKYTTRCCSFDIQTEIWDNCTFPALPFGVQKHKMFTVGHTLVVVGGVRWDADDSFSDPANTHIFVYNTTEEQPEWRYASVSITNDYRYKAGTEDYEQDKIFVVMPRRHA